MAITPRSSGALGSRLPSVVATAVALMAFTACGEDDRVPAPLVVVPNEVLADLVERVSCVEPVQTTIGLDAGDDPTPILVVTLDEPSDAETLTVSVPAVATTIDQPGPDDPWVWLDPTRFAEIARGVAAALASSGRFDPPLLDRCLARIDAEMAQLDEDLFTATQEIPDDLRSIDVSAPGTLYFASRYEFLIDESAASVRAGRIISSDTLDGADSYDAMMRANVDQVVEILESR
jgi:ABC-type Zn uptake system ZnuABC Zn-binding protein ZnuA